MAMRSGRNLSTDDLQRAEAAERETLLDNDSDSDEDTVFKQTGSAEGQLHIDGKLSSVKIQIKEVTDVMRDNVQRVMERGERLEDLQVQSDRLNSVGNEFREAARKAHRRAWMQNMRGKMILAAVTLLIVLFILVLDVAALYLALR